jgi:hypothetical protein
MAVFGLPALHFLTTANQEERLVLIALARRAQKVVDTLQHNQAVRIVETLGKAMKRG